jgi:hypothetical protein
VKQVRYIGQDNRVLIDVGSFSFGDVFNVDDDFAQRLVVSYPDAYEYADGSEPVLITKIDDDALADEPIEPVEPLKPTRVSSSSSDDGKSSTTTSTSTSTS